MDCIKEKIKNIKINKKQLVVAVVYFAFVFSTIQWAVSFYMDSFAASLLALASVIFFFFGGKFLRSGFLFTLGASVLFQNHLVVNYSYPFAKIGKEILVLLSETTTLEFQTYLQIVSKEEYTDFFTLVAICFATYTLTDRKRRLKLPILVGIFVLFFALWNDIWAPVYAFQKEMSESSKIIQQYKSFRFQAKDVSEQESTTCIIVIGETHRQDYFEKYGYSKKYSPNLLLARENKDLYSFTDMTSGFSYTTGSVPLILTRKPIDCETRFFEEKSIITAFKEAGYATYTISYTKKTQPEDDAMNLLFLEADEYINHALTTNFVDDVGMFPHIQKILEDKSSKKKLIVIKMIGAHYLYEERYPKEFELVKPSYKTIYNGGDAANNPELLKNSYKNAVIYTSNFIDQLAKVVYGRKEPTLMAFISDHGTALYEDGSSKFVGRTKGVYHIPFFITGNKAYWADVPDGVRQNLAKNQDKPLTQAYFLETYLSLAQIDYFDPRPQFDITKDQFEKAKDRIVWTGIGLEKYDDLMPKQAISKDNIDLE